MICSISLKPSPYLGLLCFPVSGYIVARYLKLRMQTSQQPASDAELLFALICSQRDLTSFARQSKATAMHSRPSLTRDPKCDVLIGLARSNKFKEISIANNSNLIEYDKTPSSY